MRHVKINHRRISAAFLHSGAEFFVAPVQMLRDKTRSTQGETRNFQPIAHADDSALSAHDNQGALVNLDVRWPPGVEAVWFYASFGQGPRKIRPPNEEMQQKCDGG